MGASGSAEAPAGRAAVGAGGSAALGGKGGAAQGAAGTAAVGGRGGAESSGGAAAGNGGAGAQGGAGSERALFWDSFDSDSALDSARYETLSPNCSGTGRIGLDASFGHTGSHALRVDGGAGYCNHVFVRPKLAAALPSPLYVRVFVQVALPLGAGHTTFGALHDMSEDKDLRIGGQNQVLIWNRESDDATLPELSPAGVALSTAFQAGSWHCLEWMVDGSKPEMRTWLDGAAVDGLTLDAEPTADVDRQWSAKTDWHPRLLDLRFGWESYGEQAETLWFDDVAIGPARFGCATAPSPRSP